MFGLPLPQLPVSNLVSSLSPRAEAAEPRQGAERPAETGGNGGTRPPAPPPEAETAGNGDTTGREAATSDKGEAAGGASSGPAAPPPPPPQARPEASFEAQVAETTPATTTEEPARAEAPPIDDARLRELQAALVAVTEVAENWGKATGVVELVEAAAETAQGEPEEESFPAGPEEAAATGMAREAYQTQAEIGGASGDEAQAGPGDGFSIAA